MNDEEDLSLEHDWECDKKCNACEMRELCEKLEARIGGCDERINHRRICRRRWCISRN